MWALNQNSETSLIMPHYGNTSKRVISTLQLLLQVLKHITEDTTGMLLCSKTTSGWFQRSYRHHKTSVKHWPAMGLENNPRTRVSSSHLMSKPLCLKTHIWSVTNPLKTSNIYTKPLCLKTHIWSVTHPLKTSNIYTKPLWDLIISIISPHFSIFMVAWHASKHNISNPF